MRIDNAVATIAQKLREKGLLENTLVIFTSDNGPHEEGGYKPSMLDSSGPLRGHKRDLFEGGIRVPFIAHWPASIRPAQTSAQPSAFWDFPPTACEVADITPPLDTQGISYLPTLLGEGSQATHESLYWEFHEKGNRRALRSGDWKIVQYDLDVNKSGPIELYNLKEDIGETKDLSTEHPDVLRKLTALINTARTPSPLFPLPALD